MAIRPLKPTVVVESLGNVSMWREDIIEVVDVFLEAAPDREASIEVDGYALDRIEDISELSHPVISKLVVSKKGGLTLRLSRHGCVVTANDPDLTTRGMMTEVRRIAERSRRSRLLERLTGFPFWLGLFALSVGGTAIVAIVRGGQVRFYSGSISWVSFLVGLAAGIAVKLLFVALRIGESILRSKSRAEAPTFWMRKRDDLAITLGSNIVSLALGGVIGYWVNTFS